MSLPGHPGQQALLQYADRCHLIGLSPFILDEPTWAPWVTGIITVCRPLSSDWIITIHTR